MKKRNRDDAYSFSYVTPVSVAVSMEEKKEIETQLFDNNIPAVVSHGQSDQFAYIFHPHITSRRRNLHIYKQASIASVVVMIISLLGGIFISPHFLFQGICGIVVILMYIYKAGLFDEGFAIDNVIELPYAVERFPMNDLGTIDCDEKTVKWCKQAAAYADLDVYKVVGHVDVSRIKHSSRALSLPAMVIAAINISADTGSWWQADKLIGAICEYGHQQRRLNTDDALLDTLRKGIVQTYTGMLDGYVKATQEKNRPIGDSVKSQKDYWEFVFEQNPQL